VVERVRGLIGRRVRCECLQGESFRSHWGRGSQKFSDFRFQFWRCGFAAIFRHGDAPWAAGGRERVAGRETLDLSGRSGRGGRPAGIGHNSSTEFRSGFIAVLEGCWPLEDRGAPRGASPPCGGRQENWGQEDASGRFCFLATNRLTYYEEGERFRSHWGRCAFVTNHQQNSARVSSLSWKAAGRWRTAALPGGASPLRGGRQENWGQEDGV
jgi:hypothetical protein